MCTTVAATPPALNALPPHSCCSAALRGPAAAAHCLKEQQGGLQALLLHGARHTTPGPHQSDDVIIQQQPGAQVLAVGKGLVVVAKVADDAPAGGG